MLCPVREQVIALVSSGHKTGVCLACPSWLAGDTSLCFLLTLTVPLPWMYYFENSLTGTDEMAQWVKGACHQPDDLSSRLSMLMTEGEHLVL